MGSSVKPWIPAVPSSAEEENEEEQAPSSPSKLKPKPPSGRVMGKGAYQSLANVRYYACNAIISEPAPSF